ncbi:MAG: ImmA/IrrE family metallo-endopeptidase [Anaerolineaceae bacterium]|nr:ImmA/IrrE family metallo-endopeptidase [Anaerolineaceae bacterium]
MSDMIITGEVFRWAIDRAGITDKQLASSLHIKPEKIEALETGKGNISFRQAQKLADVLHVPLGYLFLSTPPKVLTPIADFRTLPGKTEKDVSTNLQDVIDDALRKRDWYRDWRKTEELPSFTFVNSFTPEDNYLLVVNSIRKTLNIPVDFAKKFNSWDEHLRKFVQTVEDAGVIVLQNGIVGNNVYRTLDLEEFRGFTLADEYAPLVFLNTKDSIAGRIFTLAHELAHLWTGTSGISNPDINFQNNQIQKIEKFCNAVAAELLVSHDLFVSNWISNYDVLDNIQNLAKLFRVSTQVILRKSYDLEIVTSEEYFTIYQDIIDLISENKKKKGGNFYNTFFTRNSKRFTHTLFSAIASGNISYLDASRLLNTNPKSIVKAMEK